MVVKFSYSPPRKLTDQAECSSYGCSAFLFGAKMIVRVNCPICGCEKTFKNVPKGVGILRRCTDCREKFVYSPSLKQGHPYRNRTTNSGRSVW